MFPETEDEFCENEGEFHSFFPVFTPESQRHYLAGFGGAIIFRIDHVLVKVKGRAFFWGDRNRREWGRGRHGYLNNRAGCRKNNHR